METLINTCFILLGLYILIGIVFAIPFLRKGIEKIDEAAINVGWGFKLLIFPGTVAFWPVLLQKWRRKNHSV